MRTTPTTTCSAPGCHATIRARYRFCRKCWDGLPHQYRKALQPLLVELRRAERIDERLRLAAEVNRLVEIAQEAMS